MSTAHDLLCQILPNASSELCKKMLSALYAEMMERVREDVKVELKMEIMTEITQLLSEHMESVPTNGTRDDMFTADSDSYEQFANEVLANDPIYCMVNHSMERRNAGLTLYADEDLIKLRKGRFNPKDPDMSECIDLSAIDNMSYEELEQNPEFDEAMNRKFGH